MTRKASDEDRWLAGMRKLQARIAAGALRARLWVFHNSHLTQEGSWLTLEASTRTRR